jgi:hypothetical protein
MTRRNTSVTVIVAWIAVMFATMAASAAPFDPMIGCWTGTATRYDQQGVQQGPEVTSTGSVTWNTAKTVMHFRQTMGPGAPPLEYDLAVSGKTATFHSADKDVTGTEVRPGVYLFVLNFKAGPQLGNWYNNHYFTAKRQRLVLGSFEPAGSHGQVETIAVQRLKKVSCYRARKAVN